VVLSKWEKYNCVKCKIMRLGTKKWNFFCQLEARQLQISLKQKPACVRLFTKGKTNVTPDNMLFPCKSKEILKP